MVKISPALNNPTEEQLEAIEEVQHDTDNIDDSTSHFAAVVAKGPTTPLRPVHLIAPRQGAADDASSQEEYDKRVLAREERQADRDRQAGCSPSASEAMVPAETTAANTTAASSVVAAALVVLVVFVLLRTQRENRRSISKRSSEAQDARFLFLGRRDLEKPPPTISCPFPLPCIFLLLFTLILLCRWARSVHRAVMRAVAAVAARAVASAKMVAALKAATVQFAFASSGDAVLEVVQAAAPHVTLTFNASSEEEGGWPRYLKLGEVDSESSTFSGEGEKECEGFSGEREKEGGEQLCRCVFAEEGQEEEGKEGAEGGEGEKGAKGQGEERRGRERLEISKKERLRVG